LPTVERPEVPASGRAAMSGPHLLPMLARFELREYRYESSHDVKESSDDVE